MQNFHPFPIGSHTIHVRILCVVYNKHQTVKECRGNAPVMLALRT